MEKRRLWTGLGCVLAVALWACAPMPLKTVTALPHSEGTDAAIAQQSPKMRACQVSLKRKDTLSTIEDWDFGPLHCQTYTGRFAPNTGSPKSWELAIQSADCGNQIVLNPLLERREGVNAQGALQTLLVPLLEGELSFRIPDSCQAKLILSTSLGAQRPLESK